MIVIGRQAVAEHLGFERAIPLMREAMTALSDGRTRQLLRSILDLPGERSFGVMPGAILQGPFGAKLVGVRHGAEGARPSHQGAILLFDPDSGAPVALVDAAEVTAIRTAAMSAAATDALARPDARRLAILGCGEQAWRHAAALPRVRKIDEVRVWGRSPERASAFARRIEAELGLKAESVASAGEAVEGSDIICAVTASSSPILHSRAVSDGTHVNLVGSSRAGPAEADEALVARARFFADYRPGVLAQGAEFLNAKTAGLVDDDHVLGEIGQVMAGTIQGRRASGEVTVFKSLGHVVQDLACGWDLYRRAEAEGFGEKVGF